MSGGGFRQIQQRKYCCRKNLRSKCTIFFVMHVPFFVNDVGNILGTSRACFKTF